MPAFSPTIGKFGDVTARGKPWTLWYKHHKRHFYVGVVVLFLCLIGISGWLYWQSRYIPAPGGTLVEGMVGQPQLLNPLFSGNNEVDSELVPLIFRSLLKYDDNHQLIPDLADSVHRSDDGKTYEISLGDHQWHDGRPITSRDIAFTIKLTQNEEYRGTWSGSFTGVEVEIEDERKLKLKLDESYAPFDQNLTIGLLPEHLWGGKSINQLIADPLNLSPVGSGKLEFESIQRSPATNMVESMIFGLKDGYIEQVQFSFYQTLDEAMTDFKLGKINSLGAIYSPELNAMEDFDKQEFELALIGQSYGLYFNMSSDAVKDEVTRQALAYDLPKGQLLRKIFDNHYELIDGVYDKDHWAASDSFEKYDFNSSKAKNLWKEVEGTPNHLSLLVPDKPVHKATADQIAASWKDLGVEVSVIVKNGSELNDMIEEGSGFDVVLLGEKSRPDPDRYNNWHSTQFPPAGLNISRLSNDRVDKALEDARTILDKEERIVKYATFQDYLAREVPVIWLYQPHYIYFFNNKVHGVEVGKLWNESDRFDEIEKWYVNLARR